MADKTKDEIAAALTKAAAIREVERKKFIEHKRLTARREGTVGIPPPPNADMGIWQKIRQDEGKKKGFLKEDRNGNVRYAEKYEDAAKAPKKPGKGRRKKYPSITM